MALKTLSDGWLLNSKDIVKIQNFISLPHSLTTVARLEAKEALYGQEFIPQQ